MFEGIITFIFLSYMFVLLLKYWLKNSFFGSSSCKSNCCCDCDKDKEEKERKGGIIDDIRELAKIHKEHKF